MGFSLRKIFSPESLDSTYFPHLWSSFDSLETGNFEKDSFLKDPFSQDATFLLTVEAGSFLLAMELFYLQLTILASYLQLEPFHLQF